MRFCLLLLWLLPGLGWAASSNFFSSPQDTVRLVSAANVAPDGHVELALEFRLQPGWHIYWSNAGDAGFPPNVSLAPPASAGPLSFPPPEFLLQDQVAAYVLSGHVVLPFEATGVGGAVSATINWLVCSNICIPEHAQFSLALTGGASAEAGLFSPSPILPSPFLALIEDNGTLVINGPTAQTVSTARFFPDQPGEIVNRAQQEKNFTAAGMMLSLTPAGEFDGNKELDGVLELTDRSGAMQALTIAAQPGFVGFITLPVFSACIYAFIGGLLLNLMPCVFPILAMKALSLVRLGGGHATEIRREALGYTAGVLVAMAGLGAFLLLLRALGAEIGWGFQLQSPVFVAVVAWLILLSTLSLAGVFMVSLPLGMGRRQNTFFTGLLAVAVATPCTAPFMGGAIAAALAAPLAGALGIFLCLGAGLALPFLLIGLFPVLAKFLPRPGAWMLWLQRALAVPMGLTFGWLAWVLFRQAGASGLGLFIAGSLALGLAVSQKRLRPAAILALAVLPFLRTQLAAPGLLLPGAEPYSPPRLAALLAEHRAVFIDVTAAWCITCLVNEHSTLDTPSLRSAFAAQHVALLVGDWTNRDATLTALLQANGRDGVPLYLYYPPGGSAPHILPQVLTPDIVQAAIR
jgi:thiol:disulfide interchange protein DsbD